MSAITTYDVVASPYNDPDQMIAGLFAAPASGASGIPSITDPSKLLGGDAGLGFPEYIPDLVLIPGANQAVNVTLTGSLTFTYGEAFYLMGTLGTTAFGDGLQAFSAFEISDAPWQTTAVDGTGPTTLDFSNSANLVGIVLPEGASASFGSGATYNVTAVPEPGAWVMLLAGLGLVAGAARRRI